MNEENKVRTLIVTIITSVCILLFLGNVSSIYLSLVLMDNLNIIFKTCGLMLMMVTFIVDLIFISSVRQIKRKMDVINLNTFDIDETQLYIKRYH